MLDPPRKFFSDAESRLDENATGHLNPSFSCKITPAMVPRVSFVCKINRLSKSGIANTPDEIIESLNFSKAFFCKEVHVNDTSFFLNLFSVSAIAAKSFINFYK